MSTFQHFTLLTQRFGGERFASSVLGVASLPAPQLLVMLEATAMDGTQATRTD